MNELIIIIFFLAVLLFTIAINKKSRINLKYIFFAFIFSLTALGLAIFLQWLLTRLFQINSIATSPSIIFFDSFISTGLIEESCKIFFFYLLARLIYAKAGIKKIEEAQTLNPKQLLFLAIFFGLIFASFENIAYFIQDINSIKLRIISACLFHSTIVVYYRKFILKKHKFFYFLSAVLLHGLYNFFLSLNIYFSIFSALILVFLLAKIFNLTKFSFNCKMQ